MADASLARRYARAFVELGKDEGAVERFATDLGVVSEVLALEGGILHRVLNNPGITIAERKGVLAEVLGKLDLHLLTKNFLGLLVDKNRFSLFTEIHHEYTVLADELAGRVRADVQTAFELNDALRTKVTETLAEAVGKEVIVDFTVDDTLIGGLVAEVGGKIFDASVRARLDDLQRSLLRGPAAEA